MANVSHKNLSGTQLHENKGVAAASNDTVATASSGATVWQKLTKNHLTGTGNPFGGQIFVMRDVRDPAGTGPGVIYSSGSTWITRYLSQIYNSISGASVTNHQVTLPAGTYVVYARVPGYSVGTHKCRLKNITDGTTAIPGSNAYSNANQTDSLISFVPMTISGTKVFELQWIGHNAHNNGAGVESSFPSGGNFSETEVYSELILWKIA